MINCMSPAVKLYSEHEVDQEELGTRYCPPLLPSHKGIDNMHKIKHIMKHILTRLHLERKSEYLGL